MRPDDDLLWDAFDRSGWGMRWLRHVVAAAALAGFGGLLWLDGGHLFAVAALCGAVGYVTWATAYRLRDQRRFVQVIVVGDDSLRMHHVSGRTTDHASRMVTNVHITHQGHCYDDPNEPQLLGPGSGSATLRLQIAGLQFTSRLAGLNSEELDRVQQSWRATCPKAAIDVKQIPGQFSGYSY